MAYVFEVEGLDVRTLNFFLRSLTSNLSGFKSCVILYYLVLRLFLHLQIGDCSTVVSTSGSYFEGHRPLRTWCTNLNNITTVIVSHCSIFITII